MLIPTLLVGFCSGLLFYGLSRLRFIRFIQYCHIPGPTPSLIWGHLNLIAKLIRPNISKHFQYAVHDLIKSQTHDSGLLFLDLRPAFYPMIVIYSHELAEQVTRATPQFKNSLPKAPLEDVIGHVTGRDSFLMANGEHWKDIRKSFNPAFAPNHVATFTPQIVEKVRLFLRGLDAHAESGADFSLGERCTLLTLDVIGRTILDIDVHSQDDESEQHEVVRCFRELLANLPFWPQLEWLLSPRRYRRRMEITRTIETSLQDIIKHKFDELHSENPEKSDRSVLSLGLESIETLTPQKMRENIDSIRTFIFAGYDTTSVLLQWAFYELSRTPRALAALRVELDRVLGPNSDPEVTADAIMSGEGKLGQLLYLSAIIKETLRLHPPAGTSRFVAPGSDFGLHTSQGVLRVDGAIIFLNHFSIQRDPAVYGASAEAWVPERWLEAREEPIPVSAWRPFERGPRSCIGQELAMLEARLVLAMAVRRYDFTKVGLGAPILQADGSLKLDKHGQAEAGTPLYDTFNMSAKPVDGTQMKVKFREP
ncbi:uncharacterized protein N7496_010756 [Penicillium cataractarum]|uniref:Cytochrome P450 n=1 Tax=Penicillium cataractarum TaxID=2100454 RepID=A0A9W9UUU6_9EURO|nr:uncharacterized protein N7496_010756 [Penicillium cataractarum]KAJ5358343.1 hypothetical protein N7496_010756 [Penicillium cataractarum]